MSKSELTLILTIIGLVIAACSLILPSVDKTDADKKKKKQQRMVALASLIVLVSSVVIKNYDFKSDDAEISEEELLNKAERYYATENYGEALKIYLDYRLDTNPVSLSNLGYMYENGIEVKKDLKKAKEYYYKASKLKNYESIENHIIFEIKNPISYRELLNVLEFGYKHNSEVVNDFVLRNYKFIDEKSDEDVVTEFFNLNTMQQEEILERNTSTFIIKNDGDIGFINNEFCKVNSREFGTKSVPIGYLNKPLKDGTFSIEAVYAKQQTVYFLYAKKKLLYEVDLKTHFISVEKGS